MKTPKILLIRYKDATRGQIAKAKAAYGKIDESFAQGVIFEEVLNRVQKISDKNDYDKWGRPTLIQAAIRLTQLKNLNLPENATIKEFFEAHWKQRVNNIIEVVEKIKKISLKKTGQ